MKKVLSIVAIVFIVFSCKKDEKIIATNEIPNPFFPELMLSDTPYAYGANDVGEIYNDETLLLQDNMPTDNPVTPWGATLGRVLFYDKTMSKNRTIACASCHRQEFGFSDPAKLSKGFEGGLTGRHSMALVNARYYAPGSFFWDTRAATLEEQVLMPIQDPVEMGMTLDVLVDRIKNTPYYPDLFLKAFNSTEVTSDKISKALAQFVRSIVSTTSKFDEGLARHKDPKVPFQNYTVEENTGKNIFFSNANNVNCSGCHFTTAFVTDIPRNNGVRDNDFGAFTVTRDERMIGAFKTPSLKNIAVRPPYMHNGSLETLMEVVEHYNSGLTDEIGDLDPHLKSGDEPFKMNLTDDEKDALVAFLHTLTDHELMSNKAFSNPFKR